MSKENQVEQQLDDLHRQIAQAQLDKARMELELTNEQVAQFKAGRESRSRQNKQRQAQLQKDRLEVARAANDCSHRQGGSAGRQGTPHGKGQSALTIAKMPDDRTELIMCAICRLRVFTPDPRRGSKRAQEGETAADVKARLAEYQNDVKEFSALKTLQLDKLTAEAAQPMDCGLTFRFVDEDGREVLVPRPCDAYAQGTDNRKGVSA